MTTAGDVRDHIKADLVIPDSTFDARILNAIHSALRSFRQFKYWFLEAQGQVTLLTGNSSITLSTVTDFSAPGEFEIVIGGRRYTHNDGFPFLSWSDLKQKWWNDSPLPTGYPQACALQGSTLYVSHLSDDDYDIDLTYYKQDATLPQAGDTSVWFDDGYDVIRTKAQVIFLRDSRGADAAELQPHEAAHERFLRELGRRHEKYVGSR